MRSDIHPPPTFLPPASISTPRQLFAEVNPYPSPIFFYPARAESPNGKLRALMEFVCPLPRFPGAIRFVQI